MKGRRAACAEGKKSELTVVTKAKDLCAYVMTVTQKSPNQFRFTFTSRLQNLALDVIECIYRANEVYIGPAMLEQNAGKLPSSLHAYA